MTEELRLLWPSPVGKAQPRGRGPVGPLSRGGELGIYPEDGGP